MTNMKPLLLPLLAAALLAIPAPSEAQTPVRPYDQWEATQFIAVSGRQPEDFVRTDNNWEILYHLRTPHTLSALREEGVECTDSQVLLLEAGGLIRRTDGKWASTIPILDQEQTRALREQSKGISASMYEKTKADFTALTQAVREMGFADNTLSLVFSYLLDGRMWTKLVLFDEIDSHAGWSGCYWILYEPREGIKFGTNGFGNMDLILTYIDSAVSPSAGDMDRLAEEIAACGKPTDPRLISQLKPYGLVDDDGILLFPVIRNGQDAFHRITKRLVESITTELKNHTASVSERYGIADEKVAMVVLYHEVMWDLMDNLLQERILSLPAIFTDAKTNLHRLNEVVFFVPDGLMQ